MDEEIDNIDDDTNFFMLNRSKLNNLILLTTYGDGQCGENKKRKGSKNCSLSGIVPSAGLEPARFPTGV